MNKLQWQQLAERWLVDAKVLLDAHSWSAAYYAVGYAVECALKACILARVTADAQIIFDDRRFSEKCWTHNLADLVKFAGLETIKVAEEAANKAFRRHWQIVKDWSEHSRYRTTVYSRAKTLYNAITKNPHGVMPWIKSQW